MRLLVCLVLVAFAAAQLREPFPALTSINFVDCNTDTGIQDTYTIGGVPTINMTQAPITSGLSGTISGKVSFGGWENRGVIPAGCKFRVELADWAVGQQIAVRLIHLQIPASTTAGHQWRFYLASRSQPSQGEWTAADTTVPYIATAPGWAPGSQAQWITSATHTPNPAAASPVPKRGFVVALFYTNPTTPVPITEVNVPSTAYFSLEWTITEDQCPGTSLWTPTNGAPYPILARCPLFNMINTSCCTASDETGSNAPLNPTPTQWYPAPPLQPTRGQFGSPDVTVWRDGECARHYGLARCGLYCNPKAKAFWFLNSTVTVPASPVKRYITICRKYCQAVYASCMGERFWSTYTQDGTTAIQGPTTVGDVYGVGEDAALAFCAAYYNGIFEDASPSVPASARNYVRILDTDCFDASTLAAGSTFSVSALTILLAVLALLL